MSRNELKEFEQPSCSDFLAQMRMIPGVDVTASTFGMRRRVVIVQP